MPGPPATLGTSVLLTPGAAGAPDSGMIVGIFPPWVTAGGVPLATTGSICVMVNSLSGVPYPVPIGPLASTGVTIGGQALVRLGDRIPTPPGMLIVLGPSVATFVSDGWPP
jgi:hypothetical protein